MSRLISLRFIKLGYVIVFPFRINPENTKIISGRHRVQLILTVCLTFF